MCAVMCFIQFAFFVLCGCFSTIQVLMEVKHPDSNELVKKHSDPSTEYRKIATESNNHVGLTPSVEIIVMLATLSFLVLVWFVDHSLQLTQTHNVNLEEKILSGKSIESLKALKQQNVQALSTIFILAIVFVIFVVLIEFGYLVLYNQASTQRKRRMYRILKKAIEVVDIQEAKLSAKQAEISTINRLEDNIKECETKIKEHREADKINEKEIRRLEEEKSENVAELDAANEKLEEVQKDLEKAWELLKDHVEKEVQSKRELEQELVNERAHTTKLNADLTSGAHKLKTALSKEQPHDQASSLRSRVSSLEKVQSRIGEFEAEKKKLQEEAKKKRGFWPFY